MTEIDIINHPVVQIWFKELAKNEPLKFLSLTDGLKENISKIYGKPSGETQRFAFWKKEHLGVSMYIYTDDKTSYYKIQYMGNEEQFLSDKKIGVYITVFLSKFLKDLES